MLLRLLFVALIACNIVMAAWLLLGQDNAHGRSASDPGVPELQLLADHPVSDVAAAVSAPSAGLPASGLSIASEPGPPAASRTPVAACMTLGPFATAQDLSNARVAIDNEVSRTRARQEQTMQSRGWWVHLPTSASHEQALALARRLSARHVADFFVVSGGDQPNTVSLGLFKDPANARKRRDEVAAAGFPAQMTERTERVPTYWLDLVTTDGARLDWRSRIRNATVGSHTTGCF